MGLSNNIDEYNTEKVAIEMALAGDGVIIVGKDYNLVHMNQRLRKFLQLNREKESAEGSFTKLFTAKTKTTEYEGKDAIKVWIPESNPYNIPSNPISETTEGGETTNPYEAILKGE